MAFWGTSYPKIELIDVEGTIKHTYNLNSPQSREFDWDEENDNRYNPITGKLIKRLNGYRPFLRLKYIGQISSLIEDLLEINNTSLAIRVTPHVDVSSLNFIAEITDFIPSHYDGLATIDEIEIEFTGKNLWGMIPNLDTLFTLTPTFSSTQNIMI